MVTVLRRPRSCKLSTTPLTGNISNDGYGTAVLSAIGVVNGDRILITNSYDSYNGFWYLSGYGPSYFRLSRYQGGPTLEYMQDSNAFTFLKCETNVDWSCVHLPIVYTLSSNLWPTNTTDSIRAIVGFANDNGFVRITLSGSIDANALDWLKIGSTSVDELDGSFQVITRWSATQFTINAPYALATSPYTYATATAQKYYNDYHVRIRIYGGLATGHQWASLKPYTLIEEKKLIPDDDGFIFLNVAEALKEAIQIIYNRPNYDTAPYDLDRFCQFYIEYAEGYDVSGISTVQSYTSDKSNFEGWALDAKLEFKNRYSGFLSNYVYATNDLPAKFLVEGTPTIFNGYYFDLSFIYKQDLIVNNSLILIRRQFDEFDNETIVQETISGGFLEDEGILRIQIVASDSKYELIRVGGINYSIDPLGWINGEYPFLSSGFTSIINSGSQTTLTATGLDAAGVMVAHNILPEEFRVEGITIRLSGVMTASNTADFQLIYVLKTEDGTPLTSGGLSITTPFQSFDIELEALGGIPYTLELLLSGDGAGSPMASFTLSTYTQGSITEEKRIDIWSKCYDQFIYLTWKNNLGGFNYWLFTANKEYNINISETQDKDRNPFPDWDRSYGEFADTLSQEVSRKSRREILVRSQNLTREQLEYVTSIKSSALVQQMTSKFDRRAVKVDENSFTVRSDEQKTAFEFSFRILFTDEIPSQSL